ncbi:MAG: 2-hydroxychromene-2-carboxylate isomerase, partial [Candidatus Binatales bacterium]
MAEPAFEFWFEYASTYSYPAQARIEALAAGAGVEITWRPLLLGPIFKAQGWDDSPFNIYPVKGRYMWRDLERLCEKYGLPFKRPSQFPRGSLLAARITCIAQAERWGPEFVHAVYRANFVEDRDISRTETVAEILDSLGRDAPRTIEHAQSADNKARLRTLNE